MGFPGSEPGGRPITKTESLASRFPLWLLVESACLVSSGSRPAIGYNGLGNRCSGSTSTNSRRFGKVSVRVCFGIADRTEGG